MRNPWVQRTAGVGLLARVLISGLFSWAGWIKIIDPVSFARSSDGYQMVPQDVVVLMAWVLPWLELWIAGALWTTPVFRKAAWCWALVLLVVFTIAKISAVLRGLDIECGCTGSGTPMTWSAVLENGFYIILTGFGVFWDRRFGLRRS